MRKSKLSMADQIFEDIQLAIESGGTCCGIDDAAKAIKGLVADIRALKEKHSILVKQAEEAERLRSIQAEVNRKAGEVLDAEGVPTNVLFERVERLVARMREAEKQIGVHDTEALYQLDEKRRIAAENAALRAELAACQACLDGQLAEREDLERMANRYAAKINAIGDTLIAAGVEPRSGLSWAIAQRFPPNPPCHPSEASRPARLRSGPNSRITAA
jgi:regulator of replication initiation timing